MLRRFVLYKFLKLNMLNLGNLLCCLLIEESYKLIYVIRFCVTTLIVSVTLYPAYSRVSRGNLVLRHSVLHCRFLEALRVEWQNSTPRLTSTPEQRNRNINLSKYFISSSGDRTHNQSVLQLPCSAAPRLAVNVLK